MAGPPPPPRSTKKKKKSRRAATPPPIPDKSLASREDSAVATRPVPAPDAAAAVDEITQLIANEAEALLVGASDEGDAQLADVNVRLALLNWDVLEDPEASARHLEERLAVLRGKPQS